MKIKNRHLANNSTTSSFGVHSFNEHGCTDVADEAADVLLTIPGFERCDQCVSKEAKPETKVKKSSKKLDTEETTESES